MQINKTDKGTCLHSMLYHSTSTSYNSDAFFFKPEMDLKWCMIGFIVDNHKGDKYAIKYTGEISYKPERITVP